MERLPRRRFGRMVYFTETAMFGEFQRRDACAVIFDDTASPSEVHGDVDFRCISIQGILQESNGDPRQTGDLLGRVDPRDGIFRQRQDPRWH